MGIEQELLEIEHRLAGEGGDAYREHLAADAVVVVPGESLDRDGTIAAIDASPGWDRFSLDGPRLMELGVDAALLTYTFNGTRGENAYSALAASVYRRGEQGWRLAYHQQTPVD